MKITKAVWADHAEVSALAKLSKFTKGFASGGLRYIDTYYNNGWVYIVRLRGKIAGFCCVRHCVNRPHTSVYYIGVDPAQRGKGIGRALIQAAQKEANFPRLELISEKENEESLKFYKKLGFKIVGDGANSKKIPYWRLNLDNKH
jgi:ribosomal protein S18 acetylase RimI-like enzyme